MSQHSAAEKGEVSSNAAPPVEHDGVVAETVRSTWGSEAAGTTTAGMNRRLGFDVQLAQNKLESIPISNLPELAKGSPPPAKEKPDV